MRLVRKPALLVVLALALAPFGAARGAQAPVSSDAILDAYEAGDFTIVSRTIKTPRDVVAHQDVIEALLHEPPGRWSRAHALLVLDLAAVGVNQHFPASGFADPRNLLGRGATYVMGRPTALGVSPDEDAFEVLWHKAAIGLLEQLPTRTTEEVDRYADTMATRFDRHTLEGQRLYDPRFDLARPMAADLMMLRQSRGQVAPTMTASTDASWRYDKNTPPDDTLPEALVRSAFVQIRIRNPAKAVTLLYRVKDQPDDRDVTYWAYLFRGRACEDQDRVAEAAPAYRKALDVAPLAQSAGAALVALAARWGDPSGAATWAAALKAAPADTIDPWTHFSEGDGRFFAAWRDQLAKAAR